ncbi:peptide-binding protein [Thermodesulfobacteriota bacterium]
MPAYGDSLVVGTIGEPSNLIPMLASDSASHTVSGLIYNGLVKYATDLTLVGDLARSWDISDNGCQITFHLRDDVTWEDGTPFTAEDVYFGFKTITNPKTPTAYSGDYLQVQKAEVLDAQTFRVNYAQPFAPALGSWTNMVVLPKHLLEGQDITKSTLSRRPVGLGPFRLQKWIPGEKIVLEANPSYFEGRPYLDQYLLRYIPDMAAQFLELQTGTIDYMGLTPLQYTRQTDTSYFKNTFQKFKYPTFSYTYLAFNFKHPWFQDKRVRQAFAHAINKQEIIDGVLFGLGRIATGPYVPDTWPYNPNVRRYSYDPDTALRLLSEAGWTDTDGDGILDRDGQPFSFTILTNMGNPLRLKAATIIQWRLGKIGIDVDIRVLEWSTFINEFVDKRRFQAIILGWSIGLDPDQHDIWHSTKTGEREFNFISYANPEVDRLLEQGRRVFDIQQRKKSYYPFQELLAEDLPYIFLYVAYATPIIHARFQNITATPIGIQYNIHRWHVPRQLQKHTIIP